MKRYSSITRKTSRHSSARQRRLKWGSLLLVTMLLAVLLLDDVVGTAASFIGVPIKKAERWINESSGSVPTYIRDRSKLLAEIRALEERLRAANDNDLSHRRISNENAELRALLSAEASERIAAGVIMRPNETPYDTLLIDRGSRDGIQKDAAVYGPNDMLLGMIGKVYPKSALVVLVTAPDVVSTTYIYGPDIYTEAVGQGGGVIRLGVPQEVSLNKGDLVVLPSVDPGIFGTISHTESSESSPEQYGYVTSPVPLQELRAVSVSTHPIAVVSFSEAQEAIEEMHDELLRLEVPDEMLTSTSSAATSTNTSE